MKVILSGFGVGEQEFDIHHAQRILDLQKNNPPTVWTLKDPNFKLENGKLLPIELEG